MVISNADLMFIGVSARWPGSVHDARVLRQSAIFEAFEGPVRPVRGYILGDSGYMLRNWLLTPVLNPDSDVEEDEEPPEEEPPEEEAQEGLPANERLRVAAGRTERDRLINAGFNH
ncbi:hypothetical protein ACOMHN_059738 [Nucella lapillus]